MKDNFRYILLIFFLTSAVMYKQLMSNSFFLSMIGDAYTYTSWAWQFTQSLKEGILYPRWMPLFFWGYGSPSFILYSPLAFYLVAFFNIFSNSIIVAINYTKFMSFFFSGIGIFFLTKEFYDKKIAFFASFFYIVLPFNVFGYYVIGTFASTISLMWFSPILLFTHKFMKFKQTRYLLYASAFYGGLISTHLLNAYMFSFVLLAFTIIMNFIYMRPKNLIALPVVIGVGSLLSAAYLLPVIIERDFLNLNAFLQGGGESYFSDFFLLPDLSNRYPSDHFWPYYRGHLLIYTFFFLITTILFFRLAIKRRDNQHLKEAFPVNIFLLGTSLFSIFLTFGLSSFFWQSIPFFSYIQFPTRWLIITSFSVSLLSAAAFSFLLYKKKNINQILFVIFIFLTFIIIDFKYIRLAPTLQESELLPPKILNSSLEHLPSWVDINRINKEDDETEKIIILEGKGEYKITSWLNVHRIIKFNAAQPLRIRIRTFNFPGWTAYLDGVQTSIKSEEGTGAIIVDVPSGQHTLELLFRDTPIRFYSKIISVASFILLIFFLLYDKLKFMHPVKRKLND